MSSLPVLHIGHVNLLSASLLAVSIEDFNEFGCPNCGYHYAETGNWCGLGVFVNRCPECDKVFMVSDGSLLGGAKLGEHPRKGVPKHGNLDRRPLNGEYLHVFEIQDIWPAQLTFFCEFCEACIFCGGTHLVDHRLFGSVHCQAAARRIMLMFKTGVTLLFRDSNPDKVMVVFSSCDRHRDRLQKLRESIADNGNVILEEMTK